MDDRGISPVIGGVLMIVLTVLLASMFAAGATSLADFGSEQDQVADLTTGTDTPNDATNPDGSDSDSDTDSDDGDGDDDEDDGDGDDDEDDGDGDDDEDDGDG